jgi:hypothetical protein
MMMFLGIDGNFKRYPIMHIMSIIFPVASLIIFELQKWNGFKQYIN